MPRFVGFFAATHAVVAVCLVTNIDIESHKNRLLKVCYVPATSAHLPRLLFIYFLLQQLTILMKQTKQVVHTLNQSIN